MDIPIGVIFCREAMKGRSGLVEPPLMFRFMLRLYRNVRDWG